MPKGLNEIELTLFDTETTGLTPKLGDRIVEIAAVRIKADKKLASFQSLVDPGRPISPAAFAVNRITAEMLKGAPSGEKVIPEFLDFLKGSYLCSYNVGFDLGFLNHELQLIGRPILEDMVTIDVLKMAKRLLPGLERYALWFVAERLGIKKVQEHRAFSDVELTLAVFYKLKEVAEAKGLDQLAHFSRLFGLNSQATENLHNQKLAEIQEAINLGVTIKIKYLSSSTAQVTERQVTPKEIRQEKNASYLVGYCALRKDERTFRVDNILDLEIL